MLMMLIRTLYDRQCRREYVHEIHWQKPRFVIHTGYCRPVDFNMSLEQKEFLFKVGYLKPPLLL